MTRTSIVLACLFCGMLITHWIDTSAAPKPLAAADSYDLPDPREPDTPTPSDDSSSGSRAINQHLDAHLPDLSVPLQSSPRTVEAPLEDPAPQTPAKKRPQAVTTAREWHWGPSAPAQAPAEKTAAPVESAKTQTVRSLPAETQPEKKTQTVRSLPAETQPERKTQTAKVEVPKTEPVKTVETPAAVAKSAEATSEPQQTVAATALRETQAQLGAAMLKLRAARAELESVQKQAAVADGELRAQQARLRAVEAELAARQKGLAAVQAELAARGSELKNVQTELAAQASELDRLRAQVAGSASELKSLQRKLAQVPPQATVVRPESRRESRRDNRPADRVRRNLPSDALVDPAELTGGDRPETRLPAPSQPAPSQPAREEPKATAGSPAENATAEETPPSASAVPATPLGPRAERVVPRDQPVEERSQVRTPERIRAAEPPRIVEQPGELSPEMQDRKRRIRKTLALYFQDLESTAVRSPWGIMHSLIAYGADTDVLVDGRRVNAIGWLCWNGSGAGQRLFYTENGELRTRQGPGFQGHRGQFLAMLAQCKVPKSFEMRVQGQRFTIDDLIRFEQKTCYPRSELTFKLIGLVHYLPSDATWTNNRGEYWDIPRVIKEELAQSVVDAACGGTHRMMGFSYAVRKRELRGEPFTGQWRRAKKYVEDFHDYTFRLQNRDGSFSTRWFEGSGADRDIDKRLQTTGHILEWMVYSLPEEKLSDPRLVKAVDYLNDLMWEYRGHKWEIGPRGHAIHALALYDERVFGARFGARRAELTRLNRALRSDDREARRRAWTREPASRSQAKEEKSWLPRIFR